MIVYTLSYLYFQIRRPQLAWDWIRVVIVILFHTKSKSNDFWTSHLTRTCCKQLDYQINFYLISHAWRCPWPKEFLHPLMTYNRVWRCWSSFFGFLRHKISQNWRQNLVNWHGSCKVSIILKLKSEDGQSYPFHLPPPSTHIYIGI